MARILRKTKPLVWGSAGAALAYLWDPDQGRSRRVRLKDQVGALLRRSSRRLEQKKRYLEGKVEGVSARATLAGSRDELVEDQVLVDKVRSEVLGSPEFRELDVVVDAVAGVVTLRGAVPDEDKIRSLEKAVSGVNGVKEVQSLLHLPETPAPNKEPSREAS